MWKVWMIQVAGMILVFDLSGDVHTDYKIYYQEYSYIRTQDKLTLMVVVTGHILCKILRPQDSQSDNVGTSTHSHLYEMSVYSLSLPSVYVKVKQWLLLQGLTDHETGSL
jgi:hypothetical protein